ncbi:MAG: histidine kinase, partial [Desulfobacterales bacterium]|nr:histidine kinase [Desulfobacterales bacterium]
IQSEKMLSVGGLAAGMAHEINNPLAGIIQNMQVIGNRFNKKARKNRRVAERCGVSLEDLNLYMEERGLFPMMDLVLESGKRAAKIVDNMLSFSRKSDARFSDHDLARLLDDTLELASKDYVLKKKYDFRDIEIKRFYDDPAPRVPCEGSKIQQVFLNILKNGAEAMTEDVDRDAPPCFTLRVTAGESMARVEIGDNGSGM